MAGTQHLYVSVGGSYIGRQILHIWTKDFVLPHSELNGYAKEISIEVSHNTHLEFVPFSRELLRCTA